MLWSLFAISSWSPILSSNLWIEIWHSTLSRKDSFQKPPFILRTFFFPSSYRPTSESGGSVAGATSGFATGERQRRFSGAISELQVGGGATASESYSRSTRYHRSRSELGSPPHRYASQTLLDAPRPGPHAPHARKDALQSLQRELDSLTRSPPRPGAEASTGATGATTTGGGYSSDTGFLESSRSAGRTTRTQQQTHDYGRILLEDGLWRSLSF
jgi:hypothetical protein